MASLDILCSNALNLKNKITKIEHNILWPIKNFEKYFMAHQYMPKMFHGPTKTLRPPSYILNVRSLILTKFLRIFPASGNLTKWKESRPCRVFLFFIKFWFITICDTNDKKVCLHLMPLF